VSAADSVMLNPILITSDDFLRAMNGTTQTNSIY